MVDDVLPHQPIRQLWPWLTRSRALGRVVLLQGSNCQANLDQAVSLVFHTDTAPLLRPTARLITGAQWDWPVTPVVVRFR